MNSLNSRSYKQNFCDLYKTIFRKLKSKFIKGNMQVIVLTIFWMIVVLWIMYYWYWDISTSRISDNKKQKVLFNIDPDKRHSTSSIESLEHSDNEGTRRKYMQKLKYEIKTRWPSRASITARL